MLVFYRRIYALYIQSDSLTLLTFGKNIGVNYVEASAIAERTYHQLATFDPTFVSRPTSAVSP